MKKRKNRNSSRVTKKKKESSKGEEGKEISKKGTAVMESNRDVSAR